MKRAALIVILMFATVVYPRTGAWCDEGTKSRDFQVYSLGEVLVTADDGSATSVSMTNEVTAEAIKATNSRTVAEALNYVPGLNVSTGYKNEPNVRIHGFDQTRILILIDGVPYYETYYGKLDLNQIPIDNIAKIEVVKGNASVLYGPNCPAGVINIITKKAGEKPAAEAIVELGENGTNRVSVSHGMKTGMLNYWLNYGHQESDGWRMSDDYEPREGTITRRPGGTTQATIEDGGFRNNSDYKMDSFWAKVGLEADSESEYFVNFHYIEREKSHPPNVDAVTVYTSRPAFSHFAKQTRYDDWGVDLSGQQRVLDPVVLKGKLFYHNHVDDFVSYSDENYTNAIAVSRYEDYMTGGSLIGDVQPAKWDTVKVSLNYRGDSHKDRDDTYLPFAETFSYTGSIGLENDFRLIENLSLVLGASYDWFRVTEAQRNVTTSTGGFLRQDDLTEPGTKEEFNPMIGATYALDGSSRVYGSVARKVRFPGLKQLFGSRDGNTELEAERSINYTLGVDRSFASYGRAELGLFYCDVSDFISKDAAGLAGVYQNFAEISYAGFELNGEVNLASDLALRAGYTYIKACDKSPGHVTEDVLFVPEHKIDAGVKYTIPYVRTGVDLTGTYVGKVYSQLPSPASPNQEVKQADDYFVLNARISQSFLTHFEAYVAVNNILDKNYEAESGFPSPGRNFWVGLRAKL